MITTFLISQVVGLLIFCVVSFSIYCYLVYKRNKFVSQSHSRRPVWYLISVMFLSFLFISGISYRLAMISDGLHETSLVGIATQTRKESEFTAPENPL